MKPLDRTKLSQLLIELRKSRDLAREDMGILLNTSGRTVRRWENGEVLPSMEDIIAICNEFNISLEEMFEGEISIDREVNRRLSKVNSDIESISYVANSTDRTVNSISDEINDLKEKIELMNHKGQGLDDLTWLWVLIVHLTGTTVGFICYVIGGLRFSVAFFASLLYICAITVLIIKGRNSQKKLRLCFLYSLFLELNLLVNYVLFADVTPGVICNIELMLINGAMYGLQILDFYNMPLLLTLCCIVYSFWVFYCGYYMFRLEKKGE